MARTIEQLRRSSAHLHYEVTMLETLAKGLASGVLGQGALANAALEAFVLHVRVVLDFLYIDKPQPDDVVAQHFLSDGVAWKDVRPKMSTELHKARARAGKEVAHLTYSRLEVTAQTKLWPFAAIANEVGAAFQVFLRHAQRDSLDKVWFGGSAV